jgi:hypothetical protein
VNDPGLDTTGLAVGDRAPVGWVNDEVACGAQNNYYFCTATQGHAGPHVATAAGLGVVAVWP